MEIEIRNETIMTSHLQNASCSGKKNTNNGNMSSQSFASFCVSVLLGPGTKSQIDIPCGDGNVSSNGYAYFDGGKVNHAKVRKREREQNKFQQMLCSAIQEVSSAYINGEALDGAIEVLFEHLVRGGDANGSNSDGSSANPCAFSQRTDLEIFRNDLESCLANTLLHKYLSSNWNRIDDLIWINKKKQDDLLARNKETNKADIIKINHSCDDADNDNNKNCFSPPRCCWEKTRKAYFRKKIPDDLRRARKFTTVTTMLRSVRNESQSNLSSPELGISGSRNRNRSRSIEEAASFFHRRSPTVYFLGGGMGAGKSSVISYLKKTNDEMFENDPVVVEADAFKHCDPVFHALKALREKNGAAQRNINNGEDQRLSQLIHQHSTDAANQQLVVALANQRDIVVDGTMTWMPYVMQTVAMIRDAHKHRYLRGPGYSEANEQYWEKVEPMDKDGLCLPYRVEMVGVTVDAEHAVSRGIRRAIVTGRGVPVRGQLRSHRLYSQHFPTYANGRDSKTTTNNENNGGNKNHRPSVKSKVLFDRIRLFDNSSTSADRGELVSQEEIVNVEEKVNDNNTATSTPVQGTAPQKNRHQRRRLPPRCIAWRDSPNGALSVIPDAYKRFLKKQQVNDAATGVADLYKSNQTNNQHQHSQHQQHQ